MKVHTLLVLVFLGMLSLVSSQYGGQVYCGRRLATALALLCDNNLVKRSGLVQSASLAGSGWPWLRARHAGALRRGRRQVVAECCDKPCTVDELLAYCGN